jgi:hypothetical protein
MGNPLTTYFNFVHAADVIREAATLPTSLATKFPSPLYLKLAATPLVREN